MAIGTQEIIAIFIVVAVVGFALFRRLRKKGASSSTCSGCESNPSENTDEKPVHFFKKQR